MPSTSTPLDDPPPVDPHDIAIIGMSGRFPQAANLDAYWRNLADGRDCITEVPERLWDWRDFWDPTPGTPGRSYTRWGGFIEDSDRFDPLFFGISNLEAESMDPQERLFLETVHHTIEDAGYTRAGLRDDTVGLFVGAMWGSYQHYGSRDAGADSSFAVIANRASYLFDFKGPSLAVDTACSSSLTAIHLACESLRSGECSAALAGGVNVTSHPHKYLVLSRTGFAAPDGRCHSFGVDGDGYVPGDGVGALLLKPLDRARADGDRIHGVIKATAINHGGKASGFTVPTAESQRALIRTALDRAGVGARSLGYVEAHAPGTALGDPVEVRGLVQAFREDTDETDFCTIGAVKANVGHLESAAGIAGVMKVLLQMRHRQIAPTLLTGEMNPDVRLDGTPFRLARELMPWPAGRDDDGRPAPRRAAVSSFGFGGANGHVILEEHDAPDRPRRSADAHLIVLSAKTDERLRTVAQVLLDHLRRDASEPSGVAGPTDVDIESVTLRCISDVTRIRVELLDERDRLGDLLAEPGVRAEARALIASRCGIEPPVGSLSGGTVGELIDALERVGGADLGTPDTESAYLERIAATLQLGREPLEHRAAFAVASLEQLVDRLEALVDGRSGDGLHVGHVRRPDSGVGSDEEIAYVERLVQAKRHDRLGSLWCDGVDIPWTRLYDEGRPTPAELPLYPFERIRCWVRSPRTTARDLTGSERSFGSGSMDDAGLWIGETRGDHALDRMVFRRRWSPLDPIIETPGDPRSNGAPKPTRSDSADGAVLLVYPRTAERLRESLRDRGSSDTYEVVLADRTELLSSRSWTVDARDEDALAACIDNIRALRSVIFLGGVQPPDWRPSGREAFQTLQDTGVLALCHLVRALHARYEERGEAPELTVLTNCAFGVRGDDRVQPYTSAVVGLARAAAREFPHLSPRVIDVELPAADATEPSSIVEMLALLDGIERQNETAIRDGRLFVPTVHAARLPDREDVRPVFRTRGQYVLIGGAGALGEALSRYLAQSLSARLVWIGRRPLDDSIEEKISAVEALGAHVSYHAADASDPSALATVLSEIAADRPIDGVLHLAMNHDLGRLRDLEPGQLHRVLSAKVHSSYALETALKRHTVGFVALFSSAEAYVGNLGWGGYAAACSFQDAFARHWSAEAAWPVVGINWGYWDTGDRETQEALAVKGVYPMEVGRGVAILERILSARIEGAIALDVENDVLERMGFETTELPERSDDSSAHRPAPAAAPRNEPADGDARDPAPRGSVGDAGGGVRDDITAPEVERALIDLLSDVLRIDRSRFDTETDLVTFGVDSLTVIAIQKTLEERAGRLPASLFISFNTIGAVAAHVLDRHPQAAAKLVGHGTTSSDGGSRRREETDTHPPPRSEPDDAKVLCRLDPTRAARYLEAYPGRFRDDRLLDDAKDAPVEAAVARGAPRPAFLHTLLRTERSEGVEVVSCGVGTPVLLLPAVGLTVPTWRQQLSSPLVDSMRLVVPHPPGYGLSRPIRDCSTSGVVDVFLDVIDLISPDRPVHVVGSCLGSVTAMHLARFHSDRVASLTLVGAFHSTDDMDVGDPDDMSADEFQHMLKSAVERVKDDFHAVRTPDGEADSSTLLSYLLDALCANSLIAMRYLDEMRSLSVLEWAADVRVPSMCIFGDRDRIVDPGHSRTIADRIPNAELVEIDGAGHFPYLTHSAEFNRLIRRFIEKHESSSARATPGGETDRAFDGSARPDKGVMV
ncbi:MAG: alpha/beta fold hydrolase [Gemmatimonadetes bacterium]|nr:alpha/beta fold hydrolase [Gemmatimonadota bacterium]